MIRVAWLTVFSILAAACGQIKTSPEECMRMTMSTLATGLLILQLDIGRYPTDTEGLRVLLSANHNDPKWRGPYITEEQWLVDHWDQLYVYRPRHQPKPCYILYSKGENQVDDGGLGDDIVGENTCSDDTVN